MVPKKIAIQAGITVAVVFVIFKMLKYRGDFHNPVGLIAFGTEILMGTNLTSDDIGTDFWGPGA